MIKEVNSNNFSDNIGAEVMVRNSDHLESSSFTLPKVKAYRKTVGLINCLELGANKTWNDKMNKSRALHIHDVVSYLYGSPSYQYTFAWQCSVSLVPCCKLGPMRKDGVEKSALQYEELWALLFSGTTGKVGSTYATVTRLQVPS